MKESVLRIASQEGHQRVPAMKGYNIVPVNTLQRYVKGFDLQRATRENVPFKVSFGSTMAFAAFGSFADYS